MMWKSLGGGPREEKPEGEGLEETPFSFVYPMIFCQVYFVCFVFKLESAEGEK